jgi:ABC-type transport system involved in multi-copper enzyme maturation permease subunit
MSVQTGVQTPGGPASERLGDRLRFRVARWKSEPNPLWMREMRQSARLLRTPIILMVLTVSMTLMMASLGGVLTGTTSPAEAGTVLFHTYFSMAYFVVSLVGPALAANSIASEREGQTWEAVLLTGMRPTEITRGKFLSAYTAIAMYIVMLAPVGALPFLFGGITPFEVLIAFAFLFLVALLSVAFGLAISSKMGSLRGALLVTLLVAVPLGAFAFGLFGPAMSVAVNDLWDTIPEGPPIWLPTAYARAPFGIEYVVYLIAIPIAVIGLPAWLLYEITRSNLTSVTDDRSYGLKKWFLVASLAAAGIATVPLFAVGTSDRGEAVVAGVAAYGLHILFCAFLFAAEPIGPSRRVKVTLGRASRLRRLLSPSIMRATGLQLVVGLVAIAVVCAVGILYIQTTSGHSRSTAIAQILVFGAYALGFSSFVIGLTAWLRARSTGAALPRVLLLVVLFFLTAGPWIVAAIAGLMSRPSDPYGASTAVAAPSPIYAVVAISAIGKPDPGVAVPASVVMSCIYAALGTLFFFLGGSRSRRIIHEHEAILTEADRRLAEEDRAAATRAAKAGSPGRST